LKQFLKNLIVFFLLQEVDEKPGDGRLTPLKPGELLQLLSVDGVQWQATTQVCLNVLLSF
jgi:hypothetical protein